MRISDWSSDVCSSDLDRLALGIIEDAERRGTLRPGQTVIEATSGNTGIGLAMVCAQQGYPLVIVMAESFSIARRKLMPSPGARVILTPAPEKGTGMLNKAIQPAARHRRLLRHQVQTGTHADFPSRPQATHKRATTPPTPPHPMQPQTQ